MLSDGRWEHVFAQMWQRRTDPCDCHDDLILFWGRSRSLSLSHLHAILEGESALCSIGRFYDIVYGLHCCNSAKSFVKSSLIWFILDWRLMLFKSAVYQATTNMHCCYTSFNTSCLVFVPYDHSHKRTHTHTHYMCCYWVICLANR